MADLPNISLPADLPVNWQPNQIVSPDGVSVGLTPQHGYNALNQYINDAQAAINQLREFLASAGFATDDGVASRLANYLPLAGGTLSGILNHGGKRDINLGAPMAATDGATKGYVDTQAGLKLPLAGGTMSGNINFNSNKGTNLATPTATGDAATKGYVDTRDGLLLPKSGGTMTGTINHGGYRATNLATPSSSTDAATKGYVDDKTKSINANAYGVNGPCKIEIIQDGSIVRSTAYAYDSIIIPDDTFTTSYGGYINLSHECFLILFDNGTYPYQGNFLFKSVSQAATIKSMYNGYNPSNQLFIGAGWREITSVTPIRSQNTVRVTAI